MWPCTSVRPLFMTAFRMSSWPSPTTTQTAFTPVTHPEEAAKGLLFTHQCRVLQPCLQSHLYTDFPSFLMPDAVLPLSHLMLHIYLTLRSSACEPLILIVIIILCQNKTSQAWDGENLCEWGSPSHCQPPAHQIPELIQAIFLQNRAECFSLGTVLSNQLLEGEFSFIKAIHTEKNLHCKTIDIGLSLHTYKNRTTTNHCLCVYILVNFNIFHGYTPARSTSKIFV